ncbi:MAG: hypothetical protein NT027_09990 [Proteobacteria bacterium]|nr:hypothetical protein [Pseudomonadota bacterium]
MALVSTSQCASTNHHEIDKPESSIAVSNAASVPKSNKEKNTASNSDGAIQDHSTEPKSFKLFEPRLRNCASKEESKDSIKVTPFDVIRGSDTQKLEPVTLVAKIERRLFGGLNPDLKDKKVEFSLDKSILGQSVSDNDGIAKVNTLIDPKGGTSADPGSIHLVSHCFDARLEDIQMQGGIYTFSQTDPIFIVDVDEVISALSEVSVPLMSIENSPPVSGAVKNLNIVAKGYRIVYLTARDDSLANKTRSWLVAKGFPDGPLKIWDWGLKNQIGISRKLQGQYKLEFIASLKSKFSNVKFGIGNKPHDAISYAQSGIKAIIIGAKDPISDFPNGTQFVSSWDEVPKLLME